MTVPQSDHARTARQQRRTHRYGGAGRPVMSPRNVTVLRGRSRKRATGPPRSHERDRRATYIEITEKGRGMVAAILAPHKKAIAAL